MYNNRVLASVAKCFDSCSLYKYKFYVRLRRRYLLSFCMLIHISYKRGGTAFCRAASSFRRAFYDPFLVVIVHASLAQFLPPLPSFFPSLFPSRIWHPAVFHSRPGFWRRIGGRRCSRWPCTSPCMPTCSSALRRTKMRLALGYTYRSSAR